MNIGQTKLFSLIETICSVFIGYFVAFVAQIIIFPLLGLTVSLSQNLQIGAIFTVIGVTRSYFVRRFFNWLNIKFL